MNTPSTFTSRNLRVANAKIIKGFWLHDDGIILEDGAVLNAKRFTVDPPAFCHPDQLYRCNLDFDTSTATIDEVSA